MQDVAGHGRTVLFVSHNMAAVRTLCSRAALFSAGSLIQAGHPKDTIAGYFQRGRDDDNVREWPNLYNAPGNDHIRLREVRVTPPNGESVITIDTGAVIEIGFHNFDEGINLDCTVYVLSNEGVTLFESGHIISTANDALAGGYHVVGRLPGNLLNAGRYYLSVLFGKDQYYPLFRLNEVVSFDVENTTTGRGNNMSAAPGVIRPLIDWHLTHSEVFAGSGVKQNG